MLGQILRMIIMKYILMILLNYAPIMLKITKKYLKKHCLVYLTLWKLILIKIKQQKKKN